MANYNPAHKSVLDALLLGDPRVRPGKMFGFPACYAGRKLAICLYEDGVGIKLPERSAAKLLQEDPNAVPFQPLGKPRMREWVQINLHRSEDYRRYEAVFDESLRHVLAQQEATALRASTRSSTSTTSSRWTTICSSTVTS
jgi:hypothetical protein